MRTSLSVECRSVQKFGGLFNYAFYVAMCHCWGYQNDQTDKGLCIECMKPVLTTNVKICYDADGPFGTVKTCPAIVAHI